MINEDDGTEDVRGEKESEEKKPKKKQSRKKESKKKENSAVDEEDEETSTTEEVELKAIPEAEVGNWLIDTSIIKSCLII